MTKSPNEIWQATDQHCEVVRTWLNRITYVLALLLVLVAARAALGGEMYVLTEPSACRPSVEAWYRTHGHKVLRTDSVLGLWREVIIQWDNGTLTEATVGPVVGRGYCVIATRVLPPVA